MFDNLSRDGLYALHTQLHDEARVIHERAMALPSLGQEWRVLTEKHREISETMRAVYDEIDRRAAVDA